VEHRTYEIFVKLQRNCEVFDGHLDRVFFLLFCQLGLSESCLVLKRQPFSLIEFSVCFVYPDRFVKQLMSLFKLLPAEVDVANIEINLSVIGIVLNSLSVFFQSLITLLQIEQGKAFIVVVKRQGLLLSASGIVFRGILLMPNCVGVGSNCFIVLTKFVMGQS